MKEVENLEHRRYEKKLKGHLKPYGITDKRVIEAINEAILMTAIGQVESISLSEAKAGRNCYGDADDSSDVLFIVDDYDLYDFAYDCGDGFENEDGTKSDWPLGGTTREEQIKKWKERLEAVKHQCAMSKEEFDQMLEENLNKMMEQLSDEEIGDDFSPDDDIPF